MDRVIKNKFLKLWNLYFENAELPSGDCLYFSHTLPSSPLDKKNSNRSFMFSVNPKYRKPPLHPIDSGQKQRDSPRLTGSNWAIKQACA